MPNEMPVVPVKYRDHILLFLHHEWERIRDIVDSHYNYNIDIPDLSVKERLDTPLGYKLAQVARCAANETLSAHVLERVAAYIEEIKELLFLPIGLDTYEIPDTFWTTPLGEMLALAILRVKGDSLITISEAAKMCHMKTEMVSAKVRVRQLSKYFNPTAPRNQGRWLLDREEVKRLFG